MFLHLNALKIEKTMVVNVKPSNKMQCMQVFFKFTQLDLWTKINKFFSPANRATSYDSVGIFYTFSNKDTFSPISCSFCSRNTEVILMFFQLAWR